MTTTAAKQALIKLLQHPKYEMIPMKNVEQSFAHIPPEAKVSVTVSPSKGIHTTLELAQDLTRYVAPEKITAHISARLVESKAQLKGILERVQTMGMNELFIVGGDAQSPAGSFGNAYELVQAIRDINAEIRLGITSYPDGHPTISHEVLLEDLQRKQPYAQFMSSQLCFDPAKIQSWLSKVRSMGISLPLQLGIAGVVDIVKLTQIATRIGVGDSVRYLSKHAGTVLKLVAGYKPDDLLTDLEPTFADPESNIAAFHIYTFNQLEKTESWRKATLKKLGA